MAQITDGTKALLAFYDLPAEHWVHMKTSNPIEPTFATVRLRTKVTKGPGSKAAGLAMTLKLIDATEGCWWTVNAPHLVALVPSEAQFTNGTLVERPANGRPGGTEGTEDGPPGTQVAACAGELTEPRAAHAS